MYKYNMSEDDTPDKEQETDKPNELVGFCFSSHLKITDPNTKEVLVQTRGDD